jgi:hypothetical protein
VTKNKENMKAKLTLITAALLTTVLTSCKNSSTNNKPSNPVDTTKMAKGTIFYQCTMHLDVISDKSGSCTKCGMDLKAVTKK